MSKATTKSWGKSELYEVLALMVMGTCVWYIGVEFGVFENVARYSIDHHLMNLLMLSSCMGMGVVAATVRKSVLLRRAIKARIAAEALAEATARHDALTGLANRRLLQDFHDANRFHAAPVDVVLEGPVGAVSLTEYLQRPDRVLIKTQIGPRIGAFVW